jgi:hypothetical protein
VGGVVEMLYVHLMLEEWQILNFVTLLKYKILTLKLRRTWAENSHETWLMG